MIWSDGSGHPIVPAQGTVHICFAAIDGIRSEFDRYLVLLDPVERERADRFRFDVDRERFVLGHGLLRSVIGELMNEEARKIRFYRGPFGKPYLPDTDLQFSFSDTKDALLIALTRGNEVGADIETMQRSVDHVAVGEHYFTSEETEDIGNATDGKRRFLDLWTRKEAVLKASGVGIMEDLRVLRVNSPHQRMTIEHEAFVEHAAEEYDVRTWHLAEDHIVSLASPIPIKEVDFLRSKG